MPTYKTLNNKHSYRLVNSKFPPESLFDDVADEDEFESVYAIQALTNPRILDELGDLALIPNKDIPFGITGVNYATAPFTHVNPDGSRFSDGSFGMLYIADTMETAIAETKYHQEKMFQNIDGLHYDTITMRGLSLVVSGKIIDCTKNKEIHDPNSYVSSRVLGNLLRQNGELAIEYNSVRNKGAICWGFFSPRTVVSATQTKHFEFIYDGSFISSVKKISLV